MKLELKNISKSFGSVKAVNNITLEVADGEFLSLVGPSGCGKTTLLRMIAGFLQPDQGEIRFDDVVVNHVPARKRGVGMVFQNYALFPNLTAYENIAFGLRARGISETEIHSKVMALLEMVGMKGREHHYPRQLSGGQQQRTALARALAISPKILLLDEPLSALDAKVRLNLRYELRKIQQDMNITTIYVTHDQEEALSISDKVAVMQAGTFEQIGTPREVYTNPRTQFVASFIGISNILPVESVDASQGIVRWHDYLINTPSFSGQKVSFITIRPEDIQIYPIGAIDSLKKTKNVLRGVVLGRVFLGSIVRLAVDVGGRRIVTDVERNKEADFQVDNEVVLAFDRSVVGILNN